jgi:16S rRNA (cytidine1402-2'-O)-methyltransferase
MSPSHWGSDPSSDATDPEAEFASVRQAPQGSGRLFVVATPIGQLADLSERAAQTLRSVAWIAVEDSRVSRVLLDRLGIRARLVSAHQHNELSAAQNLVQRLLAGEDVALITDAGTPGISDPGARIVDAAHAAGLPVIAVPGPSAPVALLSVAGLDPGPFLFEGFLPPRDKARAQRLKHLAVHADALGAHVVLFEAPHRIERTLTDIEAVYGPNRLLVIGRELTKKFEQIHRCATGQALAWLHARAEHCRGEFVLAIAAPVQEGRGEPESSAGSANPGCATLPTPQALIELLMTELPASRAVRLAQALSGLPRQELYAIAVQVSAKAQALTDRIDQEGGESIDPAVAQKDPGPAGKPPVKPQ